jgi:hypothetical protein
MLVSEVMGSTLGNKQDGGWSKTDADFGLGKLVASNAAERLLEASSGC